MMRTTIQKLVNAKTHPLYSVTWVESSNTFPFKKFLTPNLIYLLKSQRNALISFKPSARSDVSSNNWEASSGPNEQLSRWPLPAHTTGISEERTRESRENWNYWNGYQASQVFTRSRQWFVHYVHYLLVIVETLKTFLSLSNFFTELNI